MILKCIIDLKVEHKKAILYTNYMLLSHRLIFLKHLFLDKCLPYFVITFTALPGYNTTFEQYKF